MKMNLNEAKQRLAKNGLDIKPGKKTITRFLNDPNVNKLINKAIKFQNNFNSDLEDDEEPDDYDAFWASMDDSFFYKLEKVVNNYFKENKINIEVDGINVEVYTKDDSENSYRFYKFGGNWDNADYIETKQDTMIQSPLNFFKTIFYIATGIIE